MADIIDFQSRVHGVLRPGDDRDPQDVFSEDLTDRIALRGIQQLVGRALAEGDAIPAEDGADFVVFVRRILGQTV